MEKYLKILNNIEKSKQPYMYDVVNVGEQNSEYLLVYLKGKLYSEFLLYSAQDNTEPVGCVVLRVAKNECTINTLKTNVKIQGQGIGKTMFNLACGYADLKGATTVKGKIVPIGNIAGVPSKHATLETEALIKIYEKLGAKVTICKADDPSFVCEFEQGEKFECLPDSQKDFLIKINILEKLQKNKGFKR